MITEDENKLLLPLKRAYNNYLNWLKQLKEKTPRDKTWRQRIRYVLLLLSRISIIFEDLEYTISEDELVNGFVIDNK
jgi:hypothetical protein